MLPSLQDLRVAASAQGERGPSWPKRNTGGTSAKLAHRQGANLGSHGARRRPQRTGHSLQTRSTTASARVLCYRGGANLPRWWFAPRSGSYPILFAPINCRPLATRLVAGALLIESRFTCSARPGQPGCGDQPPHRPEVSRIPESFNWQCGPPPGHRRDGTSTHRPPVHPSHRYSRFLILIETHLMPTG